MTRKLSKKKISASKIHKKKNRNRKTRNSKSKKSRHSSQKGGSENNLNSTIRNILAKDSNITSDAASKKKSLFKSFLSSLPFGNSLVGESEAKEARQLQREQDKEQEKRIEEELQEQRSPADRRKEEIADDIKTTIEDSTRFARTESFSKMIKDGRNKNISKMLNKTIDGIVGVNRETENTVEQAKKQVPSKICNAQFIANLDNLLEDCGQEELINVYNAIVRMLMSKKQFYSPTLEEKMTGLPILDYSESKQKEPDLNVKNLDVTQENKDLIQKLERQIQKKLKVKQKVAKAKKGKKGKKSKKKNPKKPQNNQNNQNPSESTV